MTDYPQLDDIESILRREYSVEVQLKELSRVGFLDSSGFVIISFILAAFSGSFLKEAGKALWEHLECFCKRYMELRGKNREEDNVKIKIEFTYEGINARLEVRLPNAVDAVRTESNTLHSVFSEIIPSQCAKVVNMIDSNRGPTSMLADVNLVYDSEKEDWLPKGNMGQRDKY